MYSVLGTGLIVVYRILANCFLYSVGGVSGSAHHGDKIYHGITDNVLWTHHYDNMSIGKAA